MYFKGDAPTFHANAFQDDTITAYYPKGNPTWTKAKRKSYGGTVTWKSYNPNTQYASVSETSDALLSLSDVSASGKFEDVLELQDMMVEDFVVVDVVPEETVVEDFDTGINTYALYQGVTSSDGTTNSASFTGLVPGENYLILSLVSEEVEDIFASDNLLYIAQETAAEDGTLSVSYLPRTASETCSVIACGASSKNLKDATISFPEMAGNADIEQVAVPTIIYGEAELEAGTDYVVVKGGVYTAPGTYEMTIRGVKNYSGLVTVSYTVGTPLCGDETSGVEHNYKDVVTAPTCTEQGYTTYTCICGDTYVDDYVDAMHTRGEGVVTTEPTEEAVGVMTYTCTVCGADETEEIPMLEHVHDFTYTSKSEATCTTHGFDTYTCKCLETYDDIFADPLGHDYKNGVCTVCGDYYLKFTSASLTLQDNLSINFKVRKALFDETGWENPYVVFDLNGKESVVTEYREVDDDYVFDFVNIAPNQMNDLISATLYAEKDGEVGVSLPVEYGVAKYSYNMLSRYTDDAYAEFRTLLVDLLNYGAQSQSYTGYNTDNLVNASLTEAQKAWGTAENREYVSVLDTAYETVENPIATWKGAGLNLKDRVEIRLTLEARNPGNLVVKARTEDGKEWEMPAGWFEPVSDGRYYVYFNGLNAGQMSEPVYFTVYEGDTVVSNTLRYSIESYVYSQSNKTAPDESLLALLKTMMKYGDAAHNYITE